MIHNGVKATPAWTQFFVLVVATCSTFASAVGIAAPAVAVPEAPMPQAPSEVWVMPNVRNMVLSQAMKAIRDVTGPAELNLSVLDRKNGQAVINQSNWEVCAQGPSAGNQISQKTKRVILYVKRFNQRTCT
ncbi:hypothetical protein [Mycolicibacterium vanbaalenii]|nr:hypothetical protein [Mycolicibacterium vanbaalenii]